VTRRSGRGSPGESRRRGAAVFAASFGRKSYDAAVAAHDTPGDAPPAVPAVSRCRARQHHGQAVNLAPGAPEAVKMSQPAGRNAAHCRGQPSGPDGEGQARGQARSARGEPQHLSEARARVKHQHTCTHY